MEGLKDLVFELDKECYDIPKWQKLKKVLVELLKLPADVMNEVIDMNIEEERQFFQEAQEEAKELRKNAACKRKANQQAS